MKFFKSLVVGLVVFGSNTSINAESNTANLVQNNASYKDLKDSAGATGLAISIVDAVDFSGKVKELERLHFKTNKALNKFHSANKDLNRRLNQYRNKATNLLIKKRISYSEKNITTISKTIKQLTLQEKTSAKEVKQLFNKQTDIENKLRTKDIPDIKYSGIVDKFKKGIGAAGNTLTVADMALDYAQIDDRVKKGSSKSLEYLNIALKGVESFIPSIPGIKTPSDLSRIIIDAGVGGKQQIKDMMNLIEMSYSDIESLKAENHFISKVITNDEFKSDVKNLGTNMAYKKSEFERMEDLSDAEQHVENLIRINKKNIGLFDTEVSKFYARNVESLKLHLQIIQNQKINKNKNQMLELLTDFNNVIQAENSLKNQLNLGKVAVNNDLIKYSKQMSDIKKQILKNNEKKLIAKNQEKQEAKQKQENAKKLAEQTKEVAKLKKAIQTAENLREENAELAEQYVKNPTQKNKDALNRNGEAFKRARDDVSEYDNGEYAQTHKYENSFTVDKDRQIKQNFDTALGGMSQEQKDILARADYDSDDFAEGVIEREQAGRDYAQEQADFYALGGGEDKLKDEKNLASLEDFFDKLLKDDDLADVNNDEKKQIDDSEKNDYAARRDSYIHLSFIGEYTGDNPYKNALIHSVNESDSNNKINATETIEPRPGRITGGDIVITPQLTNGYKYTAWGQWSLPNLLHIESDGRESKIHQGYYIIGERPTIEIPKTGNASYLGELKGDYVGNDNSVDLNSISGNISMNVDFGTQYLDADLVVKKDNSTWANAHFENVYIKHTNNKGNGQFDQHDRDKSGNSVTGGGWGLLEGYFLGDGSEAGGAFIVQKDNDGRASGVFRAKKQ
jgi:hypothetical protein